MKRVPLRLLRGLATQARQTKAGGRKTKPKRVGLAASKLSRPCKGEQVLKSWEDRVEGLIPHTDAKVPEASNLEGRRGPEQLSAEVRYFGKDRCRAAESQRVDIFNHWHPKRGKLRK